MDFGLGFFQHPSPVLEFQGGLLHVSEEFSEEEPNQQKTLSMGVVIGIVCCSEPTTMPVSLALVPCPRAEQWQTSFPLNLTLLPQPVRLSG